MKVRFVKLAIFVFAGRRTSGGPPPLFVFRNKRPLGGKRETITGALK
jgi:hypothetical protein